MPSQKKISKESGQSKTIQPKEQNSILVCCRAKSTRGKLRHAYGSNLYRVERKSNLLFSFWSWTLHIKRFDKKFKERIGKDLTPFCYPWYSKLETCRKCFFGHPLKGWMFQRSKRFLKMTKIVEMMLVKQKKNLILYWTPNLKARERHKIF